MKNQLQYSPSPYLLQHADNPVFWQMWNDENITKADQSGKLMLISIGYAACHWCHVMAHECFEDIQVAEVMNKYFTNFKIDREEFPGVDAYYMQALQLMTQRSEEHTSELQSRPHLVCRLLLEKKNTKDHANI